MILSLWQPWATLQAMGLKSIETRSWRTSWSGLVAIHAAKNRQSLLELAMQAPFASAFSGARHHLPAGWFPPINATFADVLPLGAIVAVGHLSDCDRVERLRPLARARNEEPFGNYESGRFGLVYDRIVPLPVPLLFRGAQGLRELTDEHALDAVRSAWRDGTPSFDATEATCHAE